MHPHHQNIWNVSLRLLIALCFSAATLSAEVTLAKIFGDHMVLQRDRPVKVWGTADPGESVRVQFAGQSQSTEAGADGHWSLWLDPMPANSEGRELRIDGNNKVVFSDVLVGEVWLASGQSNMEKPLGEMSGQKPTDNHELEIAQADHPQLRIFQVPHKGETKNPDTEFSWHPCSPESIEAIRFSAVGYFFGRELLQELEVPVGIIHSSFGGTMIEAWTPREAFLTDPRLKPLLDESYFAWVEGVQATELFESMIRPVLPYTLRGFLWYQGESNVMVGDSDIYLAKKEALVEGWRKAWNDAEAPFYFVQLAPFNYSDREQFPEKLTPYALPRFWEVQEACTQIPNTGMVVTTDLAGNARDIHPTNKLDVGRRLGRLALAKTYGVSKGPVRSPRFARQESAPGGRLYIHFDHAPTGLATSDGLPPSHFQIAGEDGHFFPALGELRRSAVILHSPRVPDPLYVRFAWHETANPNLINSAGLPAIPFRTDDLEIVTVRE